MRLDTEESIYLLTLLSIAVACIVLILMFDTGPGRVLIIPMSH